LPVSHVFKRYIFVMGGVGRCAGLSPDSEGDWVDAQEAYDKVAVLEAEIATLKAQLKDARKAKQT
jgi:hypothetical protein